MGTRVHLSQKGKVRRHQGKTGQKSIVLASGRYAHDFFIALTFSTGELKLSKVVNFLPLFQKYVKGDNLKYFSPQNFRKFIIKNGNIYWGKNEDVLFSGNFILSLDKSSKKEEEILYII